MNIALIVAAGSGTRLGGDRPKQFILVNDKPLMIYTIEAFNSNALIDAIVVVTNKDYIKQVNEWCRIYDLDKVKLVVAGGSTRQQSVYNGLMAAKSLCSNINKDIVLIHDGARPLVSDDIINNNIEGCRRHNATCTVIKTKDTIVKSSNNTTVDDVANRNELYQVQTPQAFKLALILDAHQRSSGNSATDDAQLVLSLGQEVYFVAGNSLNLKVTTEEDLSLFKALLK